MKNKNDIILKKAHKKTTTLKPEVDLYVVSA